MGHGHGHAHRAGPDNRGMRRLALAVIVPIAIVTVALMVWLWPHDVPAPDDLGQGTTRDGTVTSIERTACSQGEGFTEEDNVNGCGTATVEVEGAKPVTVPLPNGPGSSRVEEGDDVIVLEAPGPDGSTWSVVDHQRTNQLWLLAIAFVLAVVAFGRWRGLSALAGLAVTFAVLLLFVVPGILTGEPPVLVAIVGSAAIMLTVLYLTHGFNLPTTVAVLGTLVSLVLTGLLATWSVRAMHLTGYTEDTSLFLGTSHDVNMQGMLLAGILIGSLGVLDDVTVTQSATVTEVARANPAFGFRELYRAGTRVGRSHIASVVNTIILAYAGTSLPLMVLIAAGDQSLGDVIPDQIIAQEIVRSVVATLGLIAAVPVTTALAAMTAGRVTAEPGPGRRRA